jgi:pyruvate/2-oxoglutarate dehydrogenase complex dihydrolipoamide dehydrogenase (E3) component
MSKIIVIGSGSGGLTAAIGLKKAGYKVTVIEKHIIGGDCTNYGCVPSKALLYRAKKIRENQKFNQENNLPEIDPRKLSKKALQETRDVVNKFRDHESKEWLESQGIDIVFGEAKFIAKNKIEISGHDLEKSSEKFLNKIDDNKIQLKFDKCIIATGSRALRLPINGLDDTPYLTNTEIFDLEEAPKSLAILGNGPIGIEMAQAFNDMGTKVSVIGIADNILTRNDLEAGNELKEIMIKKGINFINANTKNISYEKKEFVLKFENELSLKAEKLLVATGRAANIELDLEKAEVDYTSRGIKVNSKTKTSNSRIFAIGDCVLNVPKFTHFAGKMGRVTVTNLAVQKYLKLPIYPAKFTTSNVPGVTYTSPELAEAGMNQETAMKKYKQENVKIFKMDLAKSDREGAQESKPGFVKLVTRGFWGRIIGVTILHERAGEMLPEFQRLIEDKKGMMDLDKIIHSYPTQLSSLYSLKTQFLLEKLGK